MRGCLAVVVVLGSGCGVPGTSDDKTAGDTDPAPGPDTATDTSTTPAPDGYVPELPTDVTEACWSWSVQRMDGELSGESVSFYDPVTLNQTHFETDWDPDGVVDYAWDVGYTADGEDYTFVRYDDDADGATDRSYEYEFDAAGLRTRTLIDDDGDGAWDEVWVYTYTGELRTLATLDEGDDGAIDVWYSYFYDEVDRPARIEADDGNDGVIDAVYVYTFADLVTDDYTYTYDDGVDGTFEETRTYAFDEHDRMIRYAYTYDDGTDVQTTYEYDPKSASEDRLAAHGTADYPDQDPYTWTEVRTYEAPGKISRLETAYDLGSDEYTWVEDWVWTCP